MSDAGRAEREYYTPKDAPVTDIPTMECPECDGAKCEWCDYEGVVPVDECILCSSVNCRCDADTERMMGER